jgi:hypothetical protein
MSNGVFEATAWLDIGILSLLFGQKTYLYFINLG